VVSLITVTAAAIIVVGLVYGLPSYLHLIRIDGIDHLAGHPFFLSLMKLRQHNTLGQQTYLWGKTAKTGWWFYYPVAFAVKTPLASLLILALAVSIAFRKLLGGQLKRMSFDYSVLAVPIFMFSAVLLLGHLDLGMQQVLPLLPFIYIAAASVIARAAPRGFMPLIAVLCAGLALESVSIFPHHLAFFNVLAGGPKSGPRILAESNIDWGQDAMSLASWLHRHPAKRLCVDYFGSADLADLDIAGAPLMSGTNGEPRIALDCVAAVSTNYLFGDLPDRGDFRWLRDVPPTARIGYSIYIFDLPKLLSTVGSPLYRADSPVFLQVLHQDFRHEPTIADPAVPGEVMVLKMTGLGPVSPAVALDQPAPLTPLSRTVVPVACQWNPEQSGPAADILFAGLSPLEVGVYQVNVRVPPGLIYGRIGCATTLSASRQRELTTTEFPVTSR
jgi:hypothetical protein